MRDLTQGSITRTIIAMAAPVAFGMLFQTMYLLVDLYFVAALGDAAVAGVGAAGTLMFMTMAVTQVLSVSAVSLMSQAVGRKDREHANLVFNQSMLLAVVFAVATLVFGLMFRGHYMSGITSDPEARAQGVLFMTWFVPSMALQFPMMAMASSLRATGIVKPGMMVQMITVLLNTVLAPVLIAGWGTGAPLGVYGAGLASMISVTVGVLMLIGYFAKLEKYVAFVREQWKPNFAVWKRMLDIGLPAGGEMLLMFVYFALVYWLIQDFGAPSQAGFSIGGRIMQSIFMPTMAIAFAIGPIVGQNFGAGRHDRVREACNKGILLNSIVMVIVTVLVHIDPTMMVRGFTEDPEVITVGADFLRIVSWNFVMQGIVFSCSGMFQGLGNTRPALISTILRLAIFIPLAYAMTLREDYAVYHIWYASVISVFCQGIFSYVLVQRELKNKLRQAPAAVPAAA
jgi:putative MATE family efflux protein